MPGPHGAEWLRIYKINLCGKEIIMDIKELFGDKSLTYADFEKAAGEHKAKFVDLSEGGYVDKGKFDGKANELKTANDTIADLQGKVKTFDGVDVEKLKQDVKDAQTKYDTDIGNLKKSSAVNLALMGAKAHDVKAVLPFVNMDAVTVDDDKVMGLDEQVQNLKKDKAFLFEDEKPAEDSQTAGHVSSAGEHHDSPDTSLDTFAAAAYKAAGISAPEATGGKE
jgi:hypothetical protein